MFALQNGGGIDDLTAHLRRGAVHHRQTGGESVRCVDDAAVGGGLADLRGDLLDVAAVGQNAGGGQCGFIQAVIIKNFHGVLTHGHIAVAHGQQHIAALEQLGELVKALNALGIALGHRQRDLVFQQVHAAVGDNEVQTVGILLGVILQASVNGVHLLECGGNEQIAVGTLLELLEQCAGGIEVIGDGDIGVGLLIGLLEGVHGLRHGGGGKHDQLYRLIRGLLCGVVPGLSIAGGIGTAVGLAAAGGEGQGQAQGQQQGQILFHVGSSFLIRWKIYLDFTE